MRALTHLHARGLHAALLAALVVMPMVAGMGYLTRGADHDPGSEAQEGKALRPTLEDPAADR